MHTLLGGNGDEVLSDVLRKSLRKVVKAPRKPFELFLGEVEAPSDLCAQILAQIYKSSCELARYELKETSLNPITSFLSPRKSRLSSPSSLQNLIFTLTLTLNLIGFTSK